MRNEDFLVDLLPRVRNEIDLIDKHLGEVESAAFDLLSAERTIGVQGAVAVKLQKIDLSRQSLQAVCSVLDVLVAHAPETGANLASEINGAVKLEAMLDRLLGLESQPESLAGKSVIFD